MPEHLRHDGQVDASGEQQRRPPVPQIMNPDGPDAGGPDKVAEGLGDLLRCERVPVLAGEDEPVVDVRLTPRLALGVLREPLRQEHPDAALPEVDPSGVTARRLGCPEDDAAVLTAAHFAHPALSVDLHNLLADDEEPAGEVDVGPAEPARLTAA
ncbi:MAG: hypothetical protein M3Q17_02550 [Actinomycetota bacterium]|nr:hypothetical protein [Actinomycetota bacterium]